MSCHYELCYVTHVPAQDKASTSLILNLLYFIEFCSSCFQLNKHVDEGRCCNEYDALYL